MTIMNRMCTLLKERKIHFHLQPAYGREDWKITIYHKDPEETQTIGPDTPISELWWLN